jgi:hypothetical protein
MRALRLASLSTFVLAGGCSLILETAEPSQCSTQRDCDANPAFRDRVCQDGFCVTPTPEVDPVSKDAGSGCVSTDICTQANSGKVSVCKVAGGACTPWQTPQCRFVHGAVKEPGAIVVGTILPFTERQADGELAPIGYADRLRHAIDLGLDDFAAALPGGVALGSGPKHPLAVLHCDSQLDPDQAKAAMTHLTQVVGAQAVIVGADADLAAVHDQAVASGTAVVCSDCLAPFPPGSSAWRISPPIALQAPMAAARVAALEADLAAGPSPPSPIKVAILTEPAVEAQAFVSALVPILRFNGKSASDNGASFLVEATEDPAKEQVAFEAHAAAVAAFEPDIVVVAMGANFPGHFLALLESRWSATKPKPSYVMTTLNLELAPFADVLGPGNDELRKRMSGTCPGFDQALQDNVDAFTLHYKLANNGQPQDGVFSGYDAFYATGLAIVAASTGPLLDGPHVSAGFERLLSGTLVDFRPSGLSVAIPLLATGPKTIDARGLASTLDWDVATHDLTPAEMGLYCFERTGDGGLAIKLDAGPRLATSTGVVTGTYSCD